MKEENIIIIFDALLKKKDSCTLLEVYAAREKYMKKHPDTYIDGCRDTVDYYLYTYLDEYYYDSKAHIIYKQDSVKCKFCNTKHRKYPKVELFNSIVESNKLW